jgi:hypothetical protein
MLFGHTLFSSYFHTFTCKTKHLWNWVEVVAVAAGAECCDTGFFLVDGDACPGHAAVHLNECTGDNVCCSEGVVGSLHDPEHEREVADAEMGTTDLMEKDKGDHGNMGGGYGPSTLPTEKPTPTPSPTPVPTPSPTPVPTPSPTPVPTPSPTPVPTPSPTPVPVASPNAVKPASTKTKTSRKSVNVWSQTKGTRRYRTRTSHKKKSSRKGHGKAYTKTRSSTYTGY